MATRKIVWTAHAKLQLREIFEYFNHRNKSNSYSLKLNKKIQSELKLVELQANIGKKTDMISIRALLIENYYIFHEIREKHIVILSVWDTRQNPESLKF